MDAVSGSDTPFSRLVRARMEERGLGLRELCRAVGLDPSFFSKVLADKRSPPHEEDLLRRIARELELDPQRLVVAAGRIPSEWRRLQTDPALVDSVRRLITGARGAVEAGAWEPRPETAGGGGALRMPEELGEELL